MPYAGDGHRIPVAENGLVGLLAIADIAAERDSRTPGVVELLTCPHGLFDTVTKCQSSRHASWSASPTRLPRSAKRVARSMLLGWSERSQVKKPC
jgi:hypothetical protein